MKDNIQQGYALPSALLIMLLVEFLLLGAIMLIFFYNQLNIRKIDKKRLELACYSAVQNFLAYSENYKYFNSYIYISSDSVNIALDVKQKGLFLELIASGQKNRDSIRIQYLFASKVTVPFDNALVITKPNLSATVTGNTKIKGNILVTRDRIIKGNIRGYEHSNDNYLEGNVYVDDTIKPKLWVDSIYTKLKMFYDTLKQNGKKVNEDFILNSKHHFEPLIENYSVEGNLIINGELRQNQRIVKRFFVKGNVIIEDNVSSNINIEIIATGKVIIENNCKLSNLIIFSEKEIQIKQGSIFKNCQLFSEYKIDAKKSIFYYPSILTVYVNTVDTSKYRNSINLSDVVYNGSVLLLCRDVGLSGNKSIISIDEHSKMQGNIYCENNLELKCTMTGVIYTYNFWNYIEPTEYINWFINIKIDRNKLDPSFLLPLGLSSVAEYILLDEKRIY